MTSSSDANGRTTKLFHDEGSLRVRQVVMSTGATVDYDYDDAELKVTRTTRLSDGTVAGETALHSNGLGQVRRQDVRVPGTMEALLEPRPQLRINAQRDLTVGGAGVDGGRAAGRRPASFSSPGTPTTACTPSSSPSTGSRGTASRRARTPRALGPPGPRSLTRATAATFSPSQQTATGGARVPGRRRRAAVAQRAGRGEGLAPPARLAAAQPDRLPQRHRDGRGGRRRAAARIPGRRRRTAVAQRAGRDEAERRLDRLAAARRGGRSRPSRPGWQRTPMAGCTRSWSASTGGPGTTSSLRQSSPRAGPAGSRSAAIPPTG